MIELGQLERYSDQFAARKIEVVVASVEKPADAAKTQEKFPHLRVIADPDGSLVTAFGTMHPKAGHQGEDIAAPTTVFVDGAGKVRRVYRSENVFSRLAANEVVAAMDKEFGTTATR